MQNQPIETGQTEVRLVRVDKDLGKLIDILDVEIATLDGIISMLYGDRPIEANKPSDPTGAGVIGSIEGRVAIIESKLHDIRDLIKRFE